MNEIIPKDSRYVPLTQQRWCCVPTCIQMVMIRHHIPILPQEVIGYHMGLVVPEESAYLFWNPRIGPRPPAGYGTQAGKKQYGPNAVFKKLKIPLKMSWSLINKFQTLESFRSYVEKVERENRDVLACFDWPTLFDSSKTEHWGHVCVLDKGMTDGTSVRIIDPDPYAPKWRVVEIIQLYEAMKVHGSTKSGGFWELKVME